MFSFPERLIAFRYLRPSKSDRFVSIITIFSFLGIMLGVATLIVVMAVMNGFRQELFTKILGLQAHITIYAESNGRIDPMPLSPDWVLDIGKIPGVIAAYPIIEGQVMASMQGKSQGVLARGLRAEDYAKKTAFATSITQGSLDALQGEDAIMIGHRLAKQLGAGLGDRINLLSPSGQATAFGTIPRVKSFEVAAIFDVGMYEYDSGFVYMSMENAQGFFNLSGKASRYEILTQDPMRLDMVKNRVFALIPGDYVLVDWQRVHASFFNAIQVERNVMFLILTLIIVVAAFNIVSGLVMLVKDKSKSIAVLRTMGATRGMIVRIFFISGASVGVIGTLCGILLGVTFALNIETVRQAIESLSGAELFAAEIYFLSKLPAQIDWSEVLSVTLMALSLSFLATIYPSLRAARLDPVETLRYE